MLLSNENRFSTAQAITATALSEDVIDLLPSGTVPPFGTVALVGDVGKGCEICYTVKVVEAFNNLTSLTIAVEVGATASLGTVVDSITVALADLTVGYFYPKLTLPAGLKEQYLGLRYTVTGTAPTTGKITAGITLGTQSNYEGP